MGNSSITVDTDDKHMKDAESFRGGTGDKGQRRGGYQSLQSCMEMLQSKFEVNSGLWTKELELKKKNLMKTQMDQEDEDRKRAAEVRKKKLELEFAECKVMLELLSKLISKQ